MEWKSNSSYPCIKYDHFLPSKILRSLVPNFSVFKPNVFLLLLSSSYGYDRICWFQAKMIINIRNELPSSCLGSLHEKVN